MVFIKHGARKTYKILSIDGGGIRGVYPAHILKCIQERFNVSLYEEFDMIAGTSTGSIIAAAAATKIDMCKVLELYRTHGNDIFRKGRFWNISHIGTFNKTISLLCCSLYKKEELYNVLNLTLGDVRLGEISKPLLLPSSDIGNGDVHVFKSQYSGIYKRDCSVKLVDAVMASCSAPMYFNPTRVNEYLLADGGIWCNNPALASVLEVHKRLDVKLEDIKILSIGTGRSKKGYGVNADKHWGFLFGWERTVLVDYVMSLQSQSTHNYLGMLLDKDQYIRINFESDKQLSLDDCSVVEDLVSIADKSFTYATKDLENFFKK